MRGDLRRAISAFLIISGPVDEHVQRLRSFTPREWERQLHWLSLSGLALTFWQRLQNSSAEGAIPPRVRTALRGYYSDHCQRVAVLRDEFDSLNRRFECAGVEHAVWKGFALIPEYCPDACLRPSYDYDYLISRDTWKLAQKELQVSGYVCKTDPGTGTRRTFRPPLASPVVPPSPQGLYSSTLPRNVELHLDPWDGRSLRISLRVPDHPLDRRVRRSWQGLDFYSLNAHDTFIFQALHAFQHILHNWCRLGWLWEIAHFLESRSADSPFWQEMSASLDIDEPLAQVVALVVHLAGGLFQAPSPVPIKDKLLGAIRGRLTQWVERYGMASALDNFHGDKSALLLHREFVRDPGDWREIRRKRLFPFHNPNRFVGSVAPGAAAPLPESCIQGAYVVRRLIHHLVTGVGYAWESARWKYRRRGGAARLS